MIIEMSKGYQITIPAKLRKKHKLKPGSKIVIDDKEDEIVLKTKKKSWDELWNEFDKEKIPKTNLSVEDMDKLIYDQVY